jgi:hypothetical protein
MRPEAPVPSRFVSVETISPASNRSRSTGAWAAPGAAGKRTVARTAKTNVVVFIT